MNRITQKQKFKFFRTEVKLLFLCSSPVILEISILDDELGHIRFYTDDTCYNFVPTDTSVTLTRINEDALKMRLNYLMTFLYSLKSRQLDLFISECVDYYSEDVDVLIHEFINK